MSYVVELFLCFIIFSFFGWCLEVLYGFYVHRRFINRGFLIGPLCPLYGTGCVLLYLLLHSFSKSPILLMIISMILCSILEYLASYLLEKIFKTRWWDYTNMKFHINGRICLEMIVPFGLLGILVVYLLFPYTLKIMNLCPPIVLYILSGMIFIIFITDLLVTFNVVMKFTKTATSAPKDMTEEITNFVRKTLSKQNSLTKRIIDSFPNFKVNLPVIKKKIKKKD